MHVQIIHAELLEFLRAGRLVGHPHQIDHDLRSIPPGGPHRLEDRRVVRDAHHGDDVGTRFRRDLDFERAGVHRLEVRDDRSARERLLQLRTTSMPSDLTSGVPASSQSAPPSTASFAASKARFRCMWSRATWRTGSMDRAYLALILKT